MACALLAPALASAATFSVTTLEDESSLYGCEFTECSLRDAILKANETAAADVVEFSAVGAGTIELNEALPTITEPLVIDATTAAGYSGTPEIVLDGSSVPGLETVGFDIGEGAEGSGIRGFSIGGFRWGIVVRSEKFSESLPSRVCANYIGVLPDGTTAFPNSYAGIGTAESAQDVEIGTGCTQGNLISGNSEFGILDAGQRTRISNNHIGVDASGGALPNGNALQTSAGIYVNENAESPFIGSNESGLPGTPENVGNVIAHNIGHGIYIPNGNSNATIRENSIFANDGAGIDFGTNAPGPTMTIEAVTPGATQTEIAWSLSGDPEETYVVDLFVGEQCDESGSGEGQVFLGEATVNTGLDGSSGNQTTPVASLPIEEIAGEVFTMTATRESVGVTSAFSPCFNEPPSTVIESTPPPASASPAAAFTFSGSDPSGFPVAGFECNLDGGGFTACSSPQEYIELGDGPHNFEVRAVDTAGKADPNPPSYAWSVESTPPEAPSLYDTNPSSPSNQTSMKLLGTAAAGTTITIYGSEACATSVLGTFTVAELEAGIPFTVAAETTQVFSATATSPTDLTSACSSPISYVEDSAAPVVTIESAPPNPSAESSATFTFKAEDPSGIAEIRCWRDGGLFVPCDSPFTYSGLEDGLHFFQIRAVDGAGNVGTANYEWTIDTTAPTVTLEEPKPANPTNATTATFTFSGDDEGSGVAQMQCRLDAGDFAACESETATTYGSLGDGEHNFEVRAVDNAGNLGTPAAYAWVVNTAAPSVAIGASKPPAVSTATSATFSFSATDSAGSGGSAFAYQCSIDAGPFTPCASPKTYDSLSSGAHRFEVLAVDQAGNVSAPAVYRWTVEGPAAAAPGTYQPAPTAPTAASSKQLVPVNGERLAVAPESGTILVKRPGQKKFTRLKEGQTIPVGSIVDATNGKVRLTSINAAGEEQTAVFYGGKFLVTQHDGSGLVILRLRGGNFDSCSAAKGSATASAAGGRKLWGSGHGNFRTEGNNGSATVRGTIWFTEDRCNGTFFRVRRGVVSVRDFTTGKTISLPAGRTYLAKP